MSKQTITLQGKTYDAITGALVQDAAAPAATRSHTKVMPSKKAQPTQTQSTTKPISRTANHTRHHSQQSAHTLMRHAVKKPTVSVRKQAKTQHALIHTQPQQITVKRSALQLDNQRLERAKATPQHTKVGRFHVPLSVPIKLTSIPVRQMPEGRPTNTPPTTPPPTPTNKPGDMFEQAIEQASHFVDISVQRKSFKKQARRHAFTLAAGTLAVLTIAGLAVYQNSPSLQLRVAGYRAGVATVTPDFNASGFSYGGASVQGARVIIGLTADGVRYQLSQQETNWSSEQMIAQVASTDASGQPNYTTITTDNTTVYRLGGSQATWVTNGIWYQLSGEQALSDEQITTLVKNT